MKTNRLFGEEAFQMEACAHKILIVDDDKAMCNLLRACLSEGYEVFDTVDPEQALGLALEHKPDAILLDLMMPKFSGFESNYARVFAP
jgi:DNA-binding response OmpR family regulator